MINIAYHCKNIDKFVEEGNIGHIVNKYKL